MRAATLCICLALSAAILAADDHVVQFDRGVDFRAIKTFSFRPSVIDSERPELDSQLVRANLTAAIRTALVARGLTETAADGDVFVDFNVSGQDYSIGPFGRAHPIPPGRGRAGRRGAGESGMPVDFTEGVLVLDLTARGSGLLIWRGVYRDSERDPSSFAKKLPADARKLLDGYPPRPR